MPFGDLDALDAAIDAGVAAVLIEAVQGEGGVVPAPPGYLEGIRALCDERGALMIVDEVQTGLGRTGRWFGFEHAGIRPDVSAWPRRSATACRSAPAGPGGTSPPCSSPATTARRTAARRSPRRPPCRAGRDARSTLRPWRERAGAAAPCLEGTPGWSAAQGSDCCWPPSSMATTARNAAAACLSSGLVVNNVTPTALRFAPPLTVSDDEIDEASAILKEVLA